MTRSHTQIVAKELNVFMGNSNGRGLVRIEEYGTGKVIATLTRNHQNQANLIMHRYNTHTELVTALEQISAAPDAECFEQMKAIATAALAAAKAGA
jgi:hypothetical protein